MVPEKDIVQVSELESTPRVPDRPIYRSLWVMRNTYILYTIFYVPHSGLTQFVRTRHGPVLNIHTAAWKPGAESLFDPATGIEHLV